MTKYRVRNAEISYPTDPAVIARLLAGEHVPFEDRGMVHRRAGDIVDDLPACSIDALLEQGAIEPVDAREVVTIGPRDVAAFEDAWIDLGRPTDTIGGGDLDESGD